jgi:hypothetical protein
MNFRPDPQDGFSPSERDFHEMAAEFAQMDADIFSAQMDEANRELNASDIPFDLPAKNNEFLFFENRVDESEMSFLPLV